MVFAYFSRLCFLPNGACLPKSLQPKNDNISIHYIAHQCITSFQRKLESRNSESCWRIVALESYTTITAAFCRYSALLELADPRACFALLGNGFGHFVAFSERLYCADLGVGLYCQAGVVFHVKAVSPRLNTGSFRCLRQIGVCLPNTAAELLLDSSFRWNDDCM